ncbi:MAG: glycosyltransferase, partial [Planctomycetaceae bacterium]|nr:glycosyltransferase [Planctomycetaceae bacterium]
MHVFGDLGCAGGAEKWFREILKLQDPRIKFDFLTSTHNKIIDDEITALGSKIHYVPFSRSPLPFCAFNPYLYAVREIIRQHQYDVLHVHQFDLAGELLRIAQHEHIPKRIMTIHSSLYNNPNILRQFVYYTCGRNWIFKYATNILPCSEYVAQTFNCANSPKTKIILTSINPEHFRFNNTNTNQLKEHYQNIFNIPQNATIIGHIGRFVKSKNHQFLIQLLAQMIKHDNNIYAILIGTGELFSKIRATINHLNLQDRIILVGRRDDVYQIISSMFDVLVLPSFYEGLP